MTFTINSKVTLNNNTSIEQLGFGTFKLVEFDEINSAVNAALNAGYRAFDTAQLYQNEKQLGKVLKQSGINRNSLFITSKIANNKQGYEPTLSAFEKTLTDLQLDYIDLF